MFPSWRNRVSIKNFMIEHGYGKVDSIVNADVTQYGVQPDSIKVPGCMMLLHAAMTADGHVVRSILQVRWPSDPSTWPALQRALLLTFVARSNCVFDLDLLLSMLPGEKFANEEVPNVGNLKLRHAKPVHWILFASLWKVDLSGMRLSWTSKMLQLVKSGQPIISEQVWQRLVSWGIDLSCEAMVDGRMMTLPDIVHDLAHPSSGSCARIFSHGHDSKEEGARQIQQLMRSTLKIFA
jgi:hypothetical protein